MYHEDDPRHVLEEPDEYERVVEVGSSTYGITRTGTAINIVEIEDGEAYPVSADEQEEVIDELENTEMDFGEILAEMVGIPEARFPRSILEQND